MRVIILRGIPGSGKSTYAKTLISPTTLILSTDDLFINPDTGSYDFVGSLLPKHHATTLRNFIEVCRNPQHYTTVVVDNTNIHLSSIIPYIRVAEAYNHSITIREFHISPILASSRNVHDVPLPIIQRSHSNYLPLPAEYLLYVEKHT